MALVQVHEISSTTLVLTIIYSYIEHNVLVKINSRKSCNYEKDFRYQYQYFTATVRVRSSSIRLRLSGLHKTVLVTLLTNQPFTIPLVPSGRLIVTMFPLALSSRFSNYGI